MNYEKAVCSFEMCKALMLFDALTGETDSYESLNQDNKDLYDACGVAIDAISRLTEVEQMERDGLLMKLPCKPKDIVYFIGCDFSKCSAYGEKYDEASCQGCEVVCDSKKTYSVYTTRAEDLRWILQRYFDFGKTYFATPEAAQAALELRLNESL